MAIATATATDAVSPSTGYWPFSWSSSTVTKVGEEADFLQGCSMEHLQGVLSEHIFASKASTQILQERQGAAQVEVAELRSALDAERSKAQERDSDIAALTRELKKVREQCEWHNTDHHYGTHDQPVDGQPFEVLFDKVRAGMAKLFEDDFGKLSDDLHVKLSEVAQSVSVAQAEARKQNEEVHFEITVLEKKLAQQTAANIVMALRASTMQAHERAAQLEESLIKGGEYDDELEDLEITKVKMGFRTKGAVSDKAVASKKSRKREACVSRTTSCLLDPEANDYSSPSELTCSAASTEAGTEYGSERLGSAPTSGNAPWRVLSQPSRAARGMASALRRGISAKEGERSWL